MSKHRKQPGLVLAVGASLVALALGCGAASAQSESIRIGVLAPLTGPLATPGKDMDDGLKLLWEQSNYQAGGRKVELVTADTTCNPDQALTQARRLVHQNKVHFILGPLCGHEGPAVAQVSKETGVPVVMDPAGADSVTQWDRTPTVIRTATSSSQIGHPFGDYLYKELGARNVTFIAQDYTFGHEVTLGAVQTFKEAGGKVAKIIWNPIGTKDYGATIASIDPASDAVVAVVVGADRIRLFEAWFNFGMEKKHKIYGGYWMHQDALPQMDDRAIGMIGNSLHYAAGLDTPENKAFTDGVRQQVQAAAVLVRRIRLHGGAVDENRHRQDQAAKLRIARRSSKPCAASRSRRRADRSSSTRTTTRSRTSTSPASRRSNIRCWAKC